MNLDEFRALKAEQEKSQVEEATPEVKEEVEPTPVQEEVKEEPKIPDEIEIEGIGKLTVDELKNGYLRQSDYTKKTQEVSKLRKEHEEALKLYEQVKMNPEFAQNIGIQHDPYVSKINELEEKLYDLQLEKEIDRMTSKYPDFEVREVLELAHQKGMTDLEDAYRLVKSTKPQVEEKVDINSIREQVKQEILKEFGITESDKGRTVISQGTNSQIKNDEPIISSAEAKVAQAMGMTPKEYAKWRDAGQ